MRLNFFASSLILALSSAIYLEEDDQDTSSLLQVEASAEWKQDGRHKSTYKRPGDNCCQVYMGANFKEPADEPLCWLTEEQMAEKGTKFFAAWKTYGDKKTKFIKGLDCGKNTWIDFGVSDSQSFAGRMAYQITGSAWQAEHKYDFIRVGPYDDKIMPAAVLFNDGKSQCGYSSSRHYYDPREKYPGEFDRDDLFSYRLDMAVDAVMLRPGYKAYLFAQPKWQGNYEVIEGAFQDGDAGEGRLKCQPVQGANIKNRLKGLGSLKIVKNKAGKATGYWKGITSSEAQEYTYTVGLTSQSSSKSAQSAAMELNKSLESGYNASVTAEAKASFAGIGASVSGTAGMHGTSKTAEGLKQSVQSEISSAASQGTTTTHKTTCTPKEGETRAGLWQWVISSEDYSVSALTPHTICRSGDLAFIEPTCSYWDCDNSDCSKCKEITVKKGDDILADVDDEIGDEAGTDEGTNDDSE